MITSKEKLSKFISKHKEKQNFRLSLGSQRPQEIVETLNGQIKNQTYYFSERKTIFAGGKQLTFYKKWEDRFVEFCLSTYLRYLREMANATRLRCWMRLAKMRTHPNINGD